MTFDPLMTRSGHPAAELWPLDPEIHHLNHGSFGAVPTAVVEVQRELQDEMHRNPVRWVCQLPDLVTEAREQVARQLQVDPAQAAFVQNLSAGATAVFHAFDNRGPVNVLVTTHGYGAVVMGAARLCERTGGRLVTVDLPLSARPDEVTSRVEDALKSVRVDLVVIDQITSATARAFPVGDICDVAHQSGALVFVDGAHAPGVLAHPVEHKADVWVGNLHKFWCAPMSAAMLVRPNPDLDLNPVIDSWNAEKSFPERFDMQGTADVTGWLCAPLAYSHIESEIGWDRVHAHSTLAMDYAAESVGAALAERGVVDAVPDVGQPIDSIRLLRLPGHRPWTHDEVDSLRVPFMDRTGIVSAFTSFGGNGYIRLSAHAYTVPSDIDAMAEIGVPTLACWDSCKSGKEMGQ